MAEVKWIKLSIGIWDDEKIRIIQSMPDGDALIIIWLRLLCLTGKTNDGGALYLTTTLPYTDEMLATIFDRPVATVRLALETFSRLGMIETQEHGLYVTNWRKYQGDGLDELREYNRLAKQRSREKQRLADVNDMSLTSQDCQGTDIDIDKDIDMSDSTSAGSSTAGVDQQPESTGQPKKAKSVFTPPTVDEVATYCRERGYHVDAVRFVAYYDSIGWMVGNHKMKNWKSAVVTWETNAKSKATQARPSPRRSVNLADAVEWPPNSGHYVSREEARRYAQ